MSLEERINKVIVENATKAFFYASGLYMHQSELSPIPIEEWRWFMRVGATYPVVKFHESCTLVHRMIEDADLTECLTSPCEYIREYRRWYESGRQD